MQYSNTGYPFTMDGYHRARAELADVESSLDEDDTPEKRIWLGKLENFVWSFETTGNGTPRVPPQHDDRTKMAEEVVEGPIIQKSEPTTST